MGSKRGAFRLAGIAVFMLALLLGLGQAASASVSPAHKTAASRFDNSDVTNASVVDPGKAIRRLSPFGFGGASGTLFGRPQDCTADTGDGTPTDGSGDAATSCDTVVADPTEAPTLAPTEEPTLEPTTAPTDEPTVEATSAPTTEPTTPAEQPALAVSIVATSDGTTAITSATSGDTVVFVYTLTNTGDADLSGITVTDTLGDLSGCPAELAAGASASCQHAYTVTDSDAPSLSVEVDATGQSADGSTTSASATIDLPVFQPQSQTVNAAAATPGSDVISVSKEADSAQPGDTGYFFITVTSTTPVSNLVLTDSLPRGNSGAVWDAYYVSNSSADCTFTDTSGSTGNDLRCVLGTLSDGSSGGGTLYVYVKTVDPITTADCDTGLTNDFAEATATYGEFSTADAVSGPATIDVFCAHLDITKEGNGPINAGDQATYTFTVTKPVDDNSDFAYNVELDDILPGNGIDWVEASDPYESCSTTPVGDGTYEVHCSFGDIGTDSCSECGSVDSIGGGLTRTVEVIGVTSPADCGSLTNSDATVYADNIPNGSTVADPATIQVLCPDVAVTKTVNSPVNAGDDATFTLTVSNPAGEGIGDAYDVVLTDVLPAFGAGDWSWSDNRCSIQSSLPSSAALQQTFTCDLGTVPAGSDPIVITLSHATTEADCGQSIENSASVSASNEPDSNTGNNSSGPVNVVVQCPDLTISKVPDASTNPEGPGAVISAGDAATFTITVGNNGPGSATFASLSDNLPSGTWTVATTPSGLCSSPATSFLNCSLGNIAAGGQVVITVSRDTTTSDCGTLSNSASADADNNGIVNDSGTINVLCPDLSVSKTANDDTISAGETAGYTITVGNAAGADVGNAYGATLTDNLPDGVDWNVDSITPPLSGDESCSITPDTGTTDQVLSCDLGTLSPGESHVIAISGATDQADCATSPLSNSASLASLYTEPITSGAATITVQCPDLTIDKTADAASVSATQDAGYKIVVGNGGPGTGFDVTVDDTLPAGTWTVTSPEGWSCEAGSPLAEVAGSTFQATAEFSCSLAELAPTGATPATFTVSRATTAADCGTLTNNASLSASNDDTASASAGVTVLCPKLTLDKSADSDSITSTETAAYTILVGNDGPGTAFNVLVGDTLPAGTWNVTAPDGWDCQTGPVVTDVGGNSFTADTSFECSVDSLAPTAGPLTFTVSRATAEGECTTLTNSATASDSAGESLSDSADVTVLCPDLTVDKTPDDQSLSAGETATFTVVISNGGDGVAKAVTLDDTLPAGAWDVASTPAGLCVSPATGALDCTIGDLAAHTSVTITAARTTLLDDCANAETTTTLANSATVDASNDDAASDSGSITVNCPKLDVKVTVDPANGTIGAGDTATFTITVTNTGTGTATNATLTDSLPGATLSNVTTAAVPDCSIASNVLTCDLGDLAASESHTITFEALTSADNCGKLTNTATATADNATANADATVTVATTLTVVCPAELSVSKTASVTQASPGDDITYFYIITNNGEDTAQNVSAVDDMGTPGDATDDEIVCDGITLGAGESFPCTMGITATADQAGTDLTNVVTVTGVSSLTGDAVTPATDSATVSIVAAVAPCSFRVTFTFVSDVDFAAANGTPAFTVNQGSVLTFPDGSEAGGGCQSDDWTFDGSINGYHVSFSFKGSLHPVNAQTTGTLRALPSLAASDLVLEVTEVTVVDWNVPGLPAPKAPAQININRNVGGAQLETSAGTADVSISPSLEVPFKSVTNYQVGKKTELPTVGSGPRSFGGSSGNLPLALITLLPLLSLALGVRVRYATTRRNG